MDWRPVGDAKAGDLPSPHFWNENRDSPGMRVAAGKKRGSQKRNAHGRRSAHLCDNRDAHRRHGPPAGLSLFRCCRCSKRSERPQTQRWLWASTFCPLSPIFSPPAAVMDIPVFSPNFGLAKMDTSGASDISCGVFATRILFITMKFRVLSTVSKLLKRK
jgi:hypothetical protein